MSGHTKGPWADIKGYIVVRGGHTLASVNSHNTAEGKANARLIAASPELLDCLKEARKHLDNADIDLAYIDEVIAKAEGRI